MSLDPQAVLADQIVEHGAGLAKAMPRYRAATLAGDRAKRTQASSAAIISSAFAKRASGRFMSARYLAREPRTALH